MTHQPDVEEMVGHLIKEHSCDEARAMLELTQRAAMDEVQKSGIASFVPTDAGGQPKTRVINLTDAVADLLFEQLDDFEKLHDVHHGTRMLAALTEERKRNDGY